MIAPLVGNLFGSAVLMAVVLLVRQPVGRAFGARAVFLLWLAPLLRLIAPSLHLPVAAPMPYIVVQTQVAASATIAPVRATLPSLDAMLAFAWAAGAILFLAFHMLRYAAFVRSALRQGKPMPGQRFGDILLWETPLVSGPAATGLIRRRIFVPSGFAAAFDPEQQRLALQHELLHHQRRDLWASAAALVVLAAHWFNPLAHAAHRAFRRDLEAACDADLLAGAGLPERQAYARTILRCVAQPMPQPICALTDCKELKGRLKMMNKDMSRLRRLGGAGAALAFAASGLLVVVPAIAQQDATHETVRKEIRNVVIKGQDGKELKESELSPEMKAKMRNCGGEKFEITTNGEPQQGKVERQRIIICAKTHGESKAQFADSLEKALARVQSDTDLSDASKAKMIAEMKAKIAELRAGK